MASESTHLLLAYHWHVGQECEQTDLNWRQRANPPFLERDEEREHTDGLPRRPRYIRAWLVDRYHHYMLGCRFPPFSGINVYFIRDKKIRVQTLHHAVLVVVLLVLLRLALRLFVKSNNDGTLHVGYYNVCLWQSDTEWTDVCPSRVGCISQKA